MTKLMKQCYSLVCMKEKLAINCPICKKKFDYYSSQFRPFCSERCKQVDLGHWIQESYTVAGEKLKSDENAALRELEAEENETFILENENDEENYD